MFLHTEKCSWKGNVNENKILAAQKFTFDPPPPPLPSITFLMARRPLLRLKKLICLFVFGRLPNISAFARI